MTEEGAVFLVLQAGQQGLARELAWFDVHKSEGKFLREGAFLVE